MPRTRGTDAVVSCTCRIPLDALTKTHDDALFSRDPVCRAGCHGPTVHPTSIIRPGSRCRGEIGDGKGADVCMQLSAGRTDLRSAEDDVLARRGRANQEPEQSLRSWMVERRQLVTAGSSFHARTPVPSAVGAVRASQTPRRLDVCARYQIRRITPAPTRGLRTRYLPT